MVSDALRAADAQKVGGDADRIKAIPTVVMRTQNGKYVRMAAGADELIRRSDALAALTSPAKVGGDEREALIQSLKNAQEWIATSREMCDEDGGAHWDALQRVIDFLGRAALSADGGENAQ